MPEAWNLVVLGDSFASVNGWPEQFADFVAAVP